MKTNSTIYIIRTKANTLQWSDLISNKVSELEIWQKSNEAQWKIDLREFDIKDNTRIPDKFLKTIFSCTTYIALEVSPKGNGHRNKVLGDS